MKQLEQCLLAFAEDKAHKEQLDVDYTICDYFPETRNHDTCLDKVIRAAERIGVKVAEMPDLWRASEDSGDYLKECKGALFYIGNGEDYPPLHTPEYDFNDRIIPVAVSIFLELMKVEEEDI